MQRPFWNQLGDGVKIIVGVIAIGGTLVGAVMYFSSLGERMALMEARADRQDTQNTKIEQLLVEATLVLYQLKEDVAVIKSVLQVNPQS